MTPKLSFPSVVGEFNHTKRPGDGLIRDSLVSNHRRNLPETLVLESRRTQVATPRHVYDFSFRVIKSHIDDQFRDKHAHPLSLLKMTPLYSRQSPIYLYGTLSDLDQLSARPAHLTRTCPNKFPQKLTNRPCIRRFVPHLSLKSWPWHNQPSRLDSSRTQ